MATAREIRLLSPEDYLEREASADSKHEFVNGFILAQAGASRAHNLISASLLARFTLHLKGNPCRAYMSDMKLRVKTNEMDAFYYPDIMVSCDQSPPSDYYEDKPVLLVEVLSDSTRSKDKLEKLNVYMKLASLKEYIVIEPKKVSVILWRKDGDNIKSYEFVEGDELTLTSIGLSFPVTDIYESVLNMIQED